MGVVPALYVAEQIIALSGKNIRMEESVVCELPIPKLFSLVPIYGKPEW